MLYLVAFLAALVIDTIPVFAPPAWTVLTFLIVRYELNPWIVVVVGTIGSTIGRYILSLYIPHVADRILSRRMSENVHFVGERLGKRFWPSFVFVLLYSLTPLSTTALFTAAGTARVKPLHILPAFFIGKFVSDAVMVFSGKLASHTIAETIHGQLSWKTAAVALAGAALMGGVFFIDWKKLLQHKRLQFV